MQAVDRRYRGPASRLSGLVCWLMVFAGLVSCGKPRQPPVTDVPGYLELRDQVGEYDFSPLGGRRIVVDPGHGGFFRGAIGQNGLTEAEVNLGVALYLRGLLEWAGAEVHLTRTADYDFLTPADSSLVSDLATRVAFVDSLQPDVFLSIHHNSNAALDRDLNETQTYYPVGREGADLDLARAIHKYLVRNLQITPAKIMAGNFHVLRNSPVPAVLGEPSMISNPVIEKRLSLAAKQELEAKAYFLGLLEYFAGGMPRWTSDYGDTIAFKDWKRTLSWHFEAGNREAPQLDPTSIRFQVDGKPHPVNIDPPAQTVSWLMNADELRVPHSIELCGRNLSGRATPVVQTYWPGTSGNKGFESWLFYERRAGEAPTRVLLSWESGSRDLDQYTVMTLSYAPVRPRYPGAGEGLLGPMEHPEDIAVLPVYPGKRGWLLIPATEFYPYSRTDSLRIRHTPYEMPGGEGTFCGFSELSPRLNAILHPWRWQMLGRPDGIWPEDVVPGGNWRLRILPEYRELEPGLIDMSAPVLPIRPGSPFWLEANGACPIFADENHLPPWADRGSAPPDTFFWQPVLPELIGKTIVLDPTGGGNDTDGTGPLGSRGTDFNLRIAERTASLLRGAGAEVLLTRDDERWVPPEEKVLLANESGADLFLTIGRCQDPAFRYSALHHHGSSTGQAWAELFAQAVAPLPAITPALGYDSDSDSPAPDAVLVAPDYAYLLRHTACPALQVGLERPVTVDVEERLLEPSHQQAEAYTLFLATAALMAGEDLLTDPGQVIYPGKLLAEHDAHFPPPADIDWLELDGNFVWLPPRWGAANEGGASEAKATEASAEAAATLSLSWSSGPPLPCRGLEHTLEIHAGPHWQFWALRRLVSGEFELKLLLDNR